MIKLVKQEVKNIGHVEDYKGLERIGRLCYRSEGKITENSYIKFIKKILKNGHLSVLEHLNILFSIEISDNVSISDYFDSPFITKTRMGNNYYVVSGNLRAFYEDLIDKKYFLIFRLIVEHLENYEIYEGIIDQERIYSEVERDMYLFSNIKKFNQSNYKKELSPILKSKHVMHTFFVVINRGISHEYVRHRWTHGITQESTRFVKYDEVEIILPSWFYEVNEKNKELYDLWYQSCENDAKTYKLLLEKGMTPQMARDNLPHSLRTSLYSTMSLRQWQIFLSRRNSDNAHPLMKEVACRIEELLKIEYPENF